jgi:hypothetical protein
VIGADPDSDLAVLKVDLLRKAQPVEFADPDQVIPAVGGRDAIRLIGRDNDGWYHQRLRRSPPASELGQLTGPVYRIPNLIQTDARSTRATRRRAGE